VWVREWWIGGFTYKSCAGGEAGDARVRDRGKRVCVCVCLLMCMCVCVYAYACLFMCVYVCDGVVEQWVHVQVMCG